MQNNFKKYCILLDFKCRISKYKTASFFFLVHESFIQCVYSTVNEIDFRTVIFYIINHRFVLDKKCYQNPLSYDYDRIKIDKTTIAKKIRIQVQYQKYRSFENASKYFFQYLSSSRAKQILAHRTKKSQSFREQHINRVYA